jgi:hypothetical protein
MKLILQPQKVEVALSDPHYPLARVWKGVTDDGREIVALIASVDSREPAAQPRLNAELAALRTDLYVQAPEVDCLFPARRIA